MWSQCPYKPPTRLAIFCSSALCLYRNAKVLYFKGQNLESGLSCISGYGQHSFTKRAEPACLSTGDEAWELERKEQIQYGVLSVLLQEEWKKFKKLWPSCQNDGALEKWSDLSTTEQETGSPSFPRWPQEHIISWEREQSGHWTSEQPFWGWHHETVLMTRMK